MNDTISDLLQPETLRKRVEDLEQEVQSLRTQLKALGGHGEAAVGTAGHERQDKTTLAPELAAANVRIKELKQTRNSLRASEGWLRAILDSATDYAIITLGLDGHVTSWNKGASNVLGWDATEALGKHTGFLFTPEDRQTGVPQHEMTRALTQGRAEGERWYQKKDGTRFWANGVVLPFRDGELHGYLKILHDQTERLRSQDALRRFGLILERMTEGVSLSTAEGVIVYTNPAEDRMFGYAPGELLGQHVTIQNAYPPDENERLVAAVIEQLRTVGSWQGEWRNIRKDGTQFVTASRITAVDVEGAPHWLCVQRDITRDKQAEAALRESEALHRASEEKLKQITDNLPALIGYVDAEQRYRFNNMAYRSWIGRSPQDLYGVHLRDAVGPEAYERVRHHVEAALAGERSGHEWWAPFEGGQRYVRSEYIPDRREDGSIAGFYVLASDLTESKRAEAALVQSEARLRLALDASHMAVWESDTMTDTITTSPELNRLLGFPPDASPSAEEIRARYYPGEREHLLNVALEALARGEQHAEAEFRVVWPDGTIRWLLLRAQLQAAPDGRPTRAVGVALDISGRKAAEERIRFQAHLLDAVDEAVIATDLRGHVIFWNRFAEQMYGWSAQEAVGQHVLDLTSASDRAKAEETLARLAQGGSWSGEFTARRRDGSTFPAHVADAPVYNEQGELVAIVGVSYDITERRRAEEHQRLLLNELNHRVKNTLATVQSIATQSLRSAQTPSGARDAIERRLIALSRAHDVLTRENWDGAHLREVVQQAIEPFKGQGRGLFRVEGADVRLSPRTALAMAMALQELGTNAVKHGALSTEAGHVELSWSVERAGNEPQLRMRWEEMGGPPVAMPKQRGFGTRLIERSLAHDLNGKVDIVFATSGVVCTISAPLSEEDAEV